MICCNEVVISVDDFGKEWKERVNEYGGQRVNFPLICDEPRCSKMLLLEGKRPYLMEDLSYIPFLYKLVPSVWNGVESVIWCYDEKDLSLIHILCEHVAVCTEIGSVIRTEDRYDSLTFRNESYSYKHTLS